MKNLLFGRLSKWVEKSTKKQEMEKSPDGLKIKP